MNKKVKKIIMIVILIAFIGAIGIVMINVNNKSVEKLNETSNTNNQSSNVQEKISTETGKVRKSNNEVTADNKNIVEISDKYFIQATNDVYYNLNEYIGKTIKMQGLIYSYQDSNGDTCYAVVRKTPGCCGTDGLAGLDIRYNGEYPKEETWVTVVGVMGTDTVFGDKVPAIQVTSLEETETGTTFVTN